MASNYTAANIKILSDLESIKQTPDMYIGEPDSPHHLLTEALDNAIDESMDGYSKLTEVTYDSKTGTVSVTDHGRGIPHGTKDITDSNGKIIETISVIEALMTRNNSGGKFDNESFKIRGGLHGLGMKIINALSTHVKITTRRDGESVTYESVDGGKMVGDITTIKEDTSDTHGTSIEFTPNEEYFESQKIRKQFIIDKCEISHSFGYSINLTIDGEPVSLGSGKVEQLLPKLDSKKTATYSSQELSYEADTGESVRLLLNYTSDTKSENNSYTNLIHNSLGGSHVYCYQDSLIKAWKPYTNGTILEGHEYDVLLGTKSVLAVFIEDPSFSSQTKERLSVPKKSLYHLFDGLTKEIHKYLESNKGLREALLKRFIEYRQSQSRLQSQKKIDDLVIINDGKKNNGNIRRRSVVPKLLECTKREQEGTELIITEGDSALGSVTQTRDVRTQAAFPIRGKILNVAKNLKILDNLKNQEVLGIVNSIGAGIGQNLDAKNSRYERIIIATDADEDGAHILSLLASLFINLLPELVKAGMIYALRPPLFGWKDKSGKYHFSNDQDEAIDSGQEYIRYKGLGQMDPEEFEASCINPVNRRLTQIIYPDDLNEFNVMMTESGAKSDILKKLGLIDTRELGTQLDEVLD